MVVALVAMWGLVATWTLATTIEAMGAAKERWTKCGQVSCQVTKTGAAWVLRVAVMMIRGATSWTVGVFVATKAGMKRMATTLKTFGKAVAQKTGVIAAWMVALLAVVLGVMKA